MKLDLTLEELKLLVRAADLGIAELDNGELDIVLPLLYSFDEYIKEQRRFS